MICKTNPIFAAVPSGTGPLPRGTGDRCAKRSQFIRRCPEMGAPVGLGPPVGADCAKRSHLSRAGAERPSPRRQALTLGSPNAAPAYAGVSFPRRREVGLRAPCHPSGEAIARNEANLPDGAGRDGAAVAWNTGQPCKTKPIWPAPVERDGGNPGGKCRRRAQACETNPILRGRAEAMDVESATICRPHPV
jgi:hypothetical protein